MAARTSSRRERTLIGANATHLIVNQMNSTLTPDLTPEELTHVTFLCAASLGSRLEPCQPLPPCMPTVGGNASYTV